MTTRAEIVAIARSYIGTPYHHRGRTPGLALDCAGIPICILRQTGARPADFDVGNYTGSPDGTMHDYCDIYLTRITKSGMQPGDVIALITDKDGRHEQHLAVLAPSRHAGHLSIIHASNRPEYMRVIEVPRLVFTRDFRFFGAWQFPGVE